MCVSVFVLYAKTQKPRMHTREATALSCSPATPTHPRNPLSRLYTRVFSVLSSLFCVRRRPHGAFCLPASNSHTQRKKKTSRAFSYGSLGAMVLRVYLPCMRTCDCVCVCARTREYESAVDVFCIYAHARPRGPGPGTELIGVGCRPEDERVFLCVLVCAVSSPRTFVRHESLGWWRRWWWDFF